MKNYFFIKERREEKRKIKGKKGAIFLSFFMYDSSFLKKLFVGISFYVLYVIVFTDVLSTERYYF